MRDQGHFTRVMRHPDSGSDHFNRIVRNPGHFDRLMEDQYDILQDLAVKRDQGRQPDLFHRIMRDKDHFIRVMRDQDNLNNIMKDPELFNRVMRNPNYVTRVFHDPDNFYRVMRDHNPFDRVMRSSDTFDRVMRDQAAFSPDIRDHRDQGVWQLQDPNSFVSGGDHRHADYSRIMQRGKYSHEKTPDHSERPLVRFITQTEKEGPNSFLRYLREDSPHYSLARLM